MDLDDSSRTWSGRARDVQERVLVGALSAVPGRELHRLAEVAHPPPLPVVVVVVVVVIAAAAIAVGSRSSSRLLLLLLLLPFRRGLRPSRARRTLVALGRDRIAIVVGSSRVGGERRRASRASVRAGGIDRQGRRLGQRAVLHGLGTKEKEVVGGRRMVVNKTMRVRRDDHNICARCG